MGGERKEMFISALGTPVSGLEVLLCLGDGLQSVCDLYVSESVVSPGVLVRCHLAV